MTESEWVCYRCGCGFDAEADCIEHLKVCRVGEISTDPRRPTTIGAFGEKIVPVAAVLRCNRCGNLFFSLEQHRVHERSCSMLPFE